MRKTFIVLTIIITNCSLIHVSAQTGTHLTVAEYNCENLFDTRHDTLKNDYDFTPEGTYHWTRSRYWKKLNAIARAILSITTSSPEHSSKPLPDVIGLCEVENDSVLLSLTKRSLLRGAGYDYIMTHSPDLRGIDVALLYSRFAFQPLSHYSLRVDTIHGMRPTRDILYVKGRLNNDDSLHIFVLHAPSRRGGERISSPYRCHVSQRVCQSTDSIILREPNAKIIVMGDFNDYGNASSLDIIKKHHLIDVSEKATGTHGARGTYRFRGEWSSLDHIFVSQSLVSCIDSCTIADSPELLEPDNKFAGVKPKRFLLFNKLNEGYSDHLPLCLHLVF